MLSFQVHAAIVTLVTASLRLPIQTPSSGGGSYELQ
jgi:hypothetical protein